MGGINQIIADPDFHNLSPEAQRIVVGKHDQDFASLSPDAQGIVLQQMIAGSKAPAAPPAEKHGYAYEGVAGVGRALKNTYLGLADAAKARDETEVSNWNPLQSVGNLVSHMASGTYDALKEAAHTPETGNTAGDMLSTYEKLPLIGPLVSKAEQAGPGYAKFSPETLGAVTEGATYVALPEMQKGVTSALGDIKAGNYKLPSVKQGVRNYMGVGDRMVERTATKALAENAADTEAVKAANEQALAKHQATTERVAAKQEAINKQTSLTNQQAARDWYEQNRLKEEVNAVDREKAAQKQAELDKQTNLANQQAAREWHEQTRKAQDINDLQKEVVGKRAALGQQITQNATKIGQDVKGLEEAVRNRGNSLYDIVNEKVKSNTISSEPLVNAVKHAEKNLIQGTPESIKQFRSIMSRGGDEGAIQTSMGTLTPDHPLYQQLQAQGIIGNGEPMAFRDLQGYYTELGQKMASGNLPGDVYQAVKFVKEQIGKEMDGMAARSGVLPDLQRARAYWRQYENTFHDMRSVAVGGSPVARVFRAEDPGFAAAPLTGKASARAVQMLAKYDPELATRAAQIAKDFESVKGLPKTFKPQALPAAPEPQVAKTVPEPAAPKLSAPPEPQTPKTLAVPQPPTMKPLPEAPNVPGVVESARQAKVLHIASGLRSVSGWDLASLAGGTVQLTRGELPTAFAVTLLRHGIGRWLDKPEVVDWISKVNDHDLQVLKQFTSQDQQKLQQGITQQLVKQARSGGHVALSDSLEQFLRPTQVQAIRSAMIAGSARYQSPSDVMLAAKNGDITPAEAARITQKMKGKAGSITRPLAPPQ